MALIDQLFSASFKGVSFLIRSGETTSGRKTVTHEYPNSDRRFVEDLGKLQKIFKIDGIVTGTGDDYFQVRDALIDALESKGPGILIHPFFGNQQVVAKPYRLSETTTKLNEAQFGMTFEKADLNIFPAQGGSNVSKIDRLKGDLLTTIQGDIGTFYEVNLLSASNFGDAQAQLTTVGESFSSNLDSVTNDTTKISEFSVVVSSFLNNINSNISDPVSLANDFIGLFNEANETASTAADRFSLFRLFFDFGVNDVEILPTTVDRIERLKNRELINRSMQISSLAQSYGAASQLTYNNSQDLLTVRGELESQYQKLIELEIEPQTRLDMTELRNQVRIFFEQESVNVPKILSITAKRTPLTILTYSFYGDIDRVASIEGLNKFDNPTFVEGDVTILTGVNE